MLMRQIFVFVLLVLMLGHAPFFRGAKAMGSTPEVGQPEKVDRRDEISVEGVRLTLGNAVDCPTIRTSSGKTLSVSYLEPTIKIGDRIRITGFMANVTTCQGQVLYAVEVKKLN